MKEVVMVPQKDFEMLKKWCKRGLTESALPDKAAKLAAKKTPTPRRS